MHYALVANDKPNSVARRLEIRPEHLKYLDELGETLILAGPFLNDKGESVGSFMVVEAESLEDAKAIYARDPYAKGDLFDSTAIKPWKLVINRTK